MASDAILRSPCVPLRSYAYDQVVVAAATLHWAEEACEAASTLSIALICAIGSYHTFQSVGALAGPETRDDPSIPSARRRLSTSAAAPLAIAIPNPELRQLVLRCALRAGRLVAACLWNVFNDVQEEAITTSSLACDALEAVSITAARGCVFALASAVQDALANGASDAGTGLALAGRTGRSPWALLPDASRSFHPCGAFHFRKGHHPSVDAAAAADAAAAVAAAAASSAHRLERNRSRDLLACVAGGALVLRSHVTVGHLNSQEAVAQFCRGALQDVPQDTPTNSSMDARTKLLGGLAADVQERAVSVCTMVMMCGAVKDIDTVAKGAHPSTPMIGERQRAICSLGAVWWLGGDG